MRTTRRCCHSQAVRLPVSPACSVRRSRTTCTSAGTPARSARTRAAVAGACVADFGDPLLAQPPERVEEPRREGVVAVVDLLAGVVLAGHPVFVQTMRDGLVAGGLSGRARGGSEGFQVTGLLGDGGVPDRHAPDGVQQQRR